MAKLLEISHEPKLLELEMAEDGRVHLVITLTKLGVVSKLDFFLESHEATAMSKALNTSG
jgi:hypothetical protein